MYEVKIKEELVSLVSFEEEWFLDFEDNRKRFVSDEEKGFEYVYLKMLCFFFYRKEMEVFKFFLELF